MKISDFQINAIHFFTPIKVEYGLSTAFVLETFVKWIDEVNPRISVFDESLKIESGNSRKLTKVTWRTKESSC